MPESRPGTATARTDPPAGGAPASGKGEADPLIGRVINGRFKIVSVIARGGMGKVYKAEQSPLKHILTSAIGSDQLAPEVGSDLCHWQDVLLLCTDGLTKHVSDSEIAEVLRSGESSETMSRKLVDLALERGGSDNITVVIGKLR